MSADVSSVKTLLNCSFRMEALVLGSLCRIPSLLSRDMPGTAVTFLPLMNVNSFLEFLSLVTMLLTRALDYPILGPKFGPIPNAKKYVFFPIPDKKFPI